MTATLNVIAGPELGRSCTLPPGSIVVIGRGSDCDLQLSDPGVSRIHCRLIVERDSVRLEDADSRFGTLVNSRPVFAQRLRPGDTIEIGDTKLRFSDGAPPVETTSQTRLAAPVLKLFPPGP